MEETNSIGLFIGTKASNSLEFWVGVSKGKYLQLDDVVLVNSELPDNQKISFYGIVDIVEKSFEGLSFDSDNKLVKEGILSASLSHIARVTITKIEPEIFVPPNPGETVLKATTEQLAKALSFDQMKQKIPMGIMRNGQTAYLNYEFINGTKGGHISISGISGVATKTSYAMFILHGIFNSELLDREHKQNSRAIIFNVKGEDLFFVDKGNNNLKEEDRELYDKLKLPVSNFNNVKLYAPSRKGSEIVPDTETRQTGIQPYGWTLWEVANQKLFRFVFAENESQISNLNYLISRVEDYLFELSKRSPKPCIEHSGEKISTLKELINYFQNLIENEDDNLEMWFGRNTPKGSISAFLRRLEATEAHLKNLIRPDMKEEHSINWNDQKVSLIDINKLHSRAKMFVVGALLNKLFTEKEQQGAKPTVFIVLDELNRYAPRGGWSPIKDILLDIAERGRSLGIILIGAQQTASEIEPRILANAAIKVNGRLDPAEAYHREYDYLTGTFRKRSLMIRPGTMIVQQPELSSPILINYPFPSWATRKDEAEQTAETENLIVQGYEDFI